MKSKALFQRLVHNWPIKILAVAAALVLFLLNRISNLEERFFSVPVSLLVNEQYMPAAPYPRVVRVTLRGDSDSIFLVLEEDIKAYVDLRDHASEGIFKAPVIVQKTGTALGIDPLEIRVEPMEITVALEQKMTRNLEVIPTIEGNPAPGYEVTQTFLSPSSITVEGPRSYVQDLSSIRTQPIDIAGKKNDFSVRVRLEDLNPLVRIRGSDVVEFRAAVKEAVIVKSYENVDIITLGLQPGLKIATTLPDGKLTIQGSQLSIENMKPEQIRLVADLSSIRSAGMYTVPTRPDLPGNFIVLNFEPAQVTLRVTGETPAPGEATTQ